MFNISAEVSVDTRIVQLVSFSSHVVKCIGKVSKKICIRFLLSSVVDHSLIEEEISHCKTSVNKLVLKGLVTVYRLLILLLYR